MQIKTFTVSISNEVNDLEVVNRFLRGHKILQVEQYFRNVPGGEAWHFCVHYLTSNQQKKISQRSRVKKDYKAELSPKQFHLFECMRKVRKELAYVEGLPAFAVFTDAELAAFTALPNLDLKGLKTVKGIGAKKMERFGGPFLAGVEELLKQEKENEKA